MPKGTSTTTPAAPKERKKARTIAEQIADLQAKEAATAKARKTKLTKELDAVDTSVLSAEGKLLKLLGKRTELRKQLGWTADEHGDINVEPVVDDPADQAEHADSSADAAS